MQGQKTDRLPDAIIDTILDAAEPYEGGKLSLYELHRLDIMDKHSVLLATRQSLGVDTLSAYDASGNELLRISGITFISDNGPKGPSGLVQIGAGGRFKLENDPHAALDILFGPGPLENQSILATLKELRKSVGVALAVLDGASN